MSLIKWIFCCLALIEPLISFPTTETIYIRTNGSDSNNCTAVVDACETWEYAISKLSFDNDSNSVTIDIGIGSFELETTFQV